MNGYWYIRASIKFLTGSSASNMLMLRSGERSSGANWGLTNVVFK